MPGCNQDVRKSTLLTGIQLPGESIEIATILIKLSPNLV